MNIPGVPTDKKRRFPEKNAAKSGSSGSVNSPDAESSVHLAVDHSNQPTYLKEEKQTSVAIMNIPDEPTDPSHHRHEMNATEAGSSGSAVPLIPAPADQTVRLTRSVTRRMGLPQPNLHLLSSRAPARNKTPRVSAENPVNEADNPDQTNVAPVNLSENQAAHNRPAPADPVDPSARMTPSVNRRLGLVEIPNLVNPNAVKRQKQINVDLLQPPQKRLAPERNQPTYLEGEEEKQTSVQPAPRGKQTTAQDNQLPPAEDPDSREAGFRLRYPNAFHDPQANPVPVPFPRTARYPFESPLLKLIESMDEQMKRTEIEMLKGIEAQLGFKSEDIEFENDSFARRLTLLEEKINKLKKAREGK